MLFPFQTKKYFKEIGIPVDVKYIDPTYMIRAVRANASDGILCTVLGQNAVSWRLKILEYHEQNLCKTCFSLASFMNIKFLVSTSKQLHILIRILCLVHQFTMQTEKSGKGQSISSWMLLSFCCLKCLCMSRFAPSFHSESEKISGSWSICWIQWYYSGHMQHSLCVLPYSWSHLPYKGDRP